jgi:hypothetical protein
LQAFWVSRLIAGVEPDGLQEPVHRGLGLVESFRSFPACLAELAALVACCVLLDWRCGVAVLPWFGPWRGLLRDLLGKGTDQGLCGYACMKAIAQTSLAEHSKFWQVLGLRK